jgi:hypothetical protein
LTIRSRGESILKRQQIHFPPKHEALREVKIWRVVKAGRVFDPATMR